ncbi:hypothetical protein GCM10010112_49360 [Actinoplanes lobatus]|uniref:Zn-dependent protease with chaperone function n=1 Tax=Actinoplanes lobatus TaxID=113568 RepID=A0A7W7MLH2_9ACTN|nr:hypothetical protein [Actinoplanes lobatus]MBB4754095.1 Zn-dependent protease with chaperone function [Actinoplanes lobatus]GGN76863.1 hypothetical protein GCM10010112_49360 [Actinoplanes lobatus]GIE40849.1 hypothetical protein Alo02nite_37470 [Actinoplanes lobatus]
MSIVLVGGVALAVLIGLQLLAMWLGGDDGPAWGPVASIVLGLIVTFLFMGLVAIVTGGAGGA